MSRILISAAVALLLAALLLWQHSREELVAGCVARGGRWDGARGACLPKPDGITIQRELFRS